MSANSTVAIVGAGPSGCTLACLLALRGLRPVVFDDDQRPALLVGESLVPASIPLLQKLGVEARVAACSTRKPGASFYHRNGTKVHFQFRKRGRGNPGYAYNIPRPAFDRILRERAEELGCRFVEKRAELVSGRSSIRELELSEESRVRAGFGKNQHPDILIDGTGRSRAFARQLRLPALRGSRKDVAHFAHFENFDHGEVAEGQVIISVLESGWSWRIPLPGKLSVGIVMNKKAAARLGGTAEERLHSAIRSEPLLREAGRKARRVSEAMTYTNYQLISERGHGPGWVTLGDAFGFVDPMLSPGLFMAMKSAELLDEHVFAPGGRGASVYESEVRDWHQSWQELVDYFYDGRVLRMGEAGNRTLANAGPLHPGHLMGRHVDRVLGGMVSGVATRSRYNRRFLGFGTSKLTWGMPEAINFAVR